MLERIHDGQEIIVLNLAIDSQDLVHIQYGLFSLFYACLPILHLNSVVAKILFFAARDKLNMSRIGYRLVGQIG